MKRLLMISSVLLLSGCYADSDTNSEGAEQVETPVTLWETPRRLRSIYDGEDIRVALHKEAVDANDPLTVTIDNNTNEALDVSFDGLILNRNGEYLGKAFYDDTRIDKWSEDVITLDLASIPFNTKDEEGDMFYTLRLPVGDLEVPLDFYIGDATDIIAATPGWYSDLADEHVVEDDQALVDWITRHE